MLMAITGSGAQGPGSFMPRRRLPAGLQQHPAPDGHDEARVFRDGNEAVGPDQAIRRAPAQQCLEARQAPGVQVALRLVEQLELAAVQCLRQAGLQLQPLLLVRHQVGRENHRTVARQPLSLAHRQLDGLGHIGGVRPVARVLGRTDAQGHGKLLVLHFEHRLHRLQQPVEQLPQRGFITERGQDDAKAETVKPIELAARAVDDRLESPGHLADQLIPHHMAKAAGDAAEMIDRDAQPDEAIVVQFPRPLLQRPPVGQSGHPVMQADEGQFLVVRLQGAIGLAHPMQQRHRQHHHHQHRGAQADAQPTLAVMPGQGLGLQLVVMAQRFQCALVLLETGAALQIEHRADPVAAHQLRLQRQRLARLAQGTGRIAQGFKQLGMAVELLQQAHLAAPCLQ